jgi:ribosomal protein S21
MRRDSSYRAITGASVEVRNGDVNGALRRLKKILDGADRQKELSKREFYEKPSVRARRSRQQSLRKAQRDRIFNFTNIKELEPHGVKHFKSKRKRRRVLDNRTAFTRIMNDRSRDKKS